MRNYFFKGITVLLAWLVLSTHAVAASNPVDMLQSLANEMIQTLKSHKAAIKSNPELVYTYANKIIVPHADIAEMSKRVLPPKIWDTATSEQRVEFQKEFTTLLVRTYASALANYQDETVQFYPVRGGYEGKSSVKVQSQIVRSDGPSIPMTYRLMLRGSEWRLFDMSVEGISLLESFRSQFADRLSQGDITSLTKDLAAHNARPDSDG